MSARRDVEIIRSDLRSFASLRVLKFEFVSRSLGFPGPDLNGKLLTKQFFRLGFLCDNENTELSGNEITPRNPRRMDAQMSQRKKEKNSGDISTT